MPTQPVDAFTAYCQRILDALGPGWAMERTPHDNFRFRHGGPNQWLIAQDEGGFPFAEVRRGKPGQQERCDDPERIAAEIRAAVGEPPPSAL